MNLRENIAVQVHTHGFPEITIDTVNRVKKYLTNNVIIVCDKFGWKDIHSLRCEKYCGIHHGQKRSPHKNQILGLSHLNRKFPNKKWYANIEYDCCIKSSLLLEDLEKAQDCWTAGFDLRDSDEKWDFLSRKLNRPIEKIRYYIGCCLFFHGDFLRLCEEKKYFQEILKWATIYDLDFPGYSGFSLDEVILPSIAASYNEKAFEFGCWEKEINRNNYAVRYPKEFHENELSENCSVIHPVKTMKFRT